MQQLGISSNAPQSKSRIRELLWPDVDNEVAIKTVTHNVMWVSFVIAGVTTLVALFGLVPTATIIDAVLFVAIGFGIRRKSRIAAVLGLVLYLGGQLTLLAQGRGGYNVILLIIFSALFLSAIRATFSFHRLKKLRVQGSATRVG
ncbi:MAG: hypothetical protein AB1898_21275 [Acidobacteriota bacterium]